MPENAETSPRLDGGPVTCSSCGWVSRAGAVTCEFCTATLAKDIPPRHPRPVECPHCGHLSAGLGTATNCPRCGRRYLEPPDATRKLAAAGTDLAAWARQHWVYLMIAGFVVITVFYMTVMSSGNQKMTTANHVRQIKGAVQVFEGSFGGFPASLDDLTHRLGPIPTHVRKDAWGVEIRYTASLPRSNNDGSEPVYTECEVRSAGSNGDFGDDDDIVWIGRLDAP